MLAFAFTTMAAAQNWKWFCSFQSWPRRLYCSLVMNICAGVRRLGLNGIYSRIAQKHDAWRAMRSLSSFERRVLALMPDEEKDHPAEDYAIQGVPEEVGAEGKLGQTAASTVRKNSETARIAAPIAMPRAVDWARRASATA